MDHRFRDPRYRGEYRNDDYWREREAREEYWRRAGEDRTWRSPDQQFETSGPYTQPRESYGEAGTRGRDFGHASQGWAPERRGGYAGRGPKGYIRTDQRILEDVCERLSRDDHVDASDVTVRVENGEVTLEGTVETRHMKRRAEDIAEEVAGVTDVHNQVRVKKPMLTELKEKITGESREEGYANTGTRTVPNVNGRP